MPSFPRDLGRRAKLDGRHTKKGVDAILKLNRRRSLDGCTVAVQILAASLFFFYENQQHKDAACVRGRGGVRDVGGFAGENRCDTRLRMISAGLLEIPE